MLQLVDAQIGDNGNLITAAVVSHYYFIGKTGYAVSLRLECGNESVAAVVVGRKEYGYGWSKHIMCIRMSLFVSVDERLLYQPP